MPRTVEKTKMYRINVGWKMYEAECCLTFQNPYFDCTPQFEEDVFVQSTTKEFKEMKIGYNTPTCLARISLTYYVLIRDDGFT